MLRAVVNIDDSACAEIMRWYRLTTKREAIDLALQTLTAETIGFDETKQLRGSGWDADLDEMRIGRSTLISADTSAALSHFERRDK